MVRRIFILGLALSFVLLSAVTLGNLQPFIVGKATVGYIVLR